MGQALFAIFKLDRLATAILTNSIRVRLLHAEVRCPTQNVESRLSINSSFFYIIRNVRNLLKKIAKSKIRFAAGTSRMNKKGQSKPRSFRSRSKVKIFEAVLRV